MAYHVIYTAVLWRERTFIFCFVDTPFACPIYLLVYIAFCGSRLYIVVVTDGYIMWNYGNHNHNLTQSFQNLIAPYSQPRNTEDECTLCYP